MNRPVRRRHVRTPLVAAALLLALAAISRVWLAHPAADEAPPEPLAEETVAVRRVVDGDTLLLANGTYLRLIGVDTPETVRPDFPVQPFGPEATQFTKDFIHGGPVQLRLDHERVDQHGRALAYVYVDGKMLNEELLKVGLARAHTGYNYSESMKKKFRTAESQARQKRLGIWSQSERPK